MLTLLYLRSSDGCEEGPYCAAGISLTTVASRRWTYEEVAGMELAERMLVALLIITSSNDGADGGEAVAVDLHLVIFLARLFRITGSGIDEVGGGATSLIATNAIRHALCLTDGGGGSTCLKLTMALDLGLAEQITLWITN